MLTPPEFVIKYEILFRKLIKILKMLGRVPETASIKDSLRPVGAEAVEGAEVKYSLVSLRES
jgi:hypothetical protein